MKMKDQKQWEINLQGKFIRLSNANFNMIRASPMEIMGWFDMGLMKAWKVIFPFTTISAQIRSLPISDPAWQTWPNSWLIFLSDKPTLVERNSHIWRTMSHHYPLPTLCRLIPVVNIIEWRMMVQALMMSRWLGNLQAKRLIQVFYPTKTSVLMIRSCEKEIGVLEHSMTLIHGKEVSSWEMKVAGLALLSQGVCEPTVDVVLLPIIHLMMNIMVWNCRGALNPNFAQTVRNMVKDSSSDILIITKTPELVEIELRRLPIGYPSMELFMRIL